jgi:hypothetical protein
LALFSNYTFPKGYLKNDFGLNKGFLDYHTLQDTLKKPAFLRDTPNETQETLLNAGFFYSVLRRFTSKIRGQRNKYPYFGQSFTEGLIRALPAICHKYSVYQAFLPLLRRLEGVKLKRNKFLERAAITSLF